MITKEVLSSYTVTIGIECHVQLKTKTKLFAAVGNDAREALPNTLVSHICFGMPGALPVLNEQAVTLAIRAALALDTKPQPFSKFDRKHYFYPDLPKGYQISQFDQPIILGGSIPITVDGEERSIGITRAHLEEDAGKSTHPTGADYSLVDLNRAGTPLLEIVSEPDMHSAAEAKAYARELYLRMKYADVSDANLYYGNMRFDVNVSVSKTDELGTRTETKNINSFRAVERSVDYEIQRQIEQLEKDQPIVQETRGWDDAKQRTFNQRSKEDAHDYRYFPDPDLPPIVIRPEQVAAAAATMPVMPVTWRKRLQEIGVDGPSIEVLLDSEVVSEAVSYLKLIPIDGANVEYVKTLTNWLINVELPLRSDAAAEIGALDDVARRTMYEQIYELLKANKLSSTNAKALIADLLRLGELPEDIAVFAASAGHIQESDESAIAAIVSAVLAANPAAAEDVRGGEMKAIGFLVGQVMKQSHGKANPALAQQLIRSQLGV